MTDQPIDSSSSIVVGRINSVHGVRGSVKATVLSDVPHRFDDGEVVYIDGNPLTIVSSASFPPKQVILQLEGIDSPEAALSLVGESLTVPETSAPELPDGEYYHFQLLGLRVVTEEDEHLGQIGEILETGSNDVYIVSGGPKELLIPALRQVVRDVRLDEGVIVVRLPEGIR